MSDLIVGINAYHGDSSACVLLNGEVAAAAEEERFRRVKHWAGFPSQSIQSCLDQVGASIADIKHVAMNSQPGAHFTRKVLFTLKNRPPVDLVAERLKNRKKRESIDEEFATAFGRDVFRGQVHGIEHHLAHLASAYYCSPFDDAVVVSVDGFGDFSSSAWGVGQAGQIRLDGRVYFPHSLGVFYQALTQYLGFPNYGDEYKVMGLAPYGRPEYVDKLKQVVQLNSDGSFELDLAYFRHVREKVDYAWDGGSPHVGELFTPALEQLLGPARKRDDELEQKHRDLAHSVQAVYELAFFNLLAAKHAQYGLDSIAIAGGCGMNSVANGKIRRKSPFKHSYIQSAAGDAGGAIGAALECHRRLNGPSNKGKMPHAYLGPSFSDTQIQEVLDSAAERIGCAACEVTTAGFDEVCDTTTGLMMNGGVVGWFQGRMEWGPRALGNRSILCDPRRDDMKDILNLKIKRRESFRPFAPSVLRERAADWFEEEDDVPFMMKVFQIRPERRAEIPAVTHVDGSGRLQTVFKDANPRYHQLISVFEAKTGVPMVLNTSFNENEPVVCTPAEALDCFLRTKMDLLVLNNTMVKRVG